VEEINTINLLSESECNRISSIVHQLKNSWIHRHFSAPFYTLGAASYLDANRDNNNYYGLAELYNSILKEHFSWLYKKLAKSLAQYLQAPVLLTSMAAIPGFHIYLPFKLFEFSVTSIHFDLQYKLVNWKSLEQTSFENPLSFTLPISLPRGGGLNLWDITYQDWLKIPKQELKELLKSKPKSFYTYQLGKMVVHSGLTIHQAVIGQNMQPNEQRFTLQGHALYSQGNWQLYW
jgi:hypothetical protein